MGKKVDLKLFQQQIQFMHDNAKANAAESFAKLSKDYLRQFTWHAESIWKNECKVRFLAGVLYNIDAVGVETAADFCMGTLEDYVSRPYNIRTSSTCALTNESSTWEFTCMLEMLKQIKND